MRNHKGRLVSIARSSNQTQSDTWAVETVDSAYAKTDNSTLT